jgi:hypothetical protein
MGNGVLMKPRIKAVLIHLFISGLIAGLAMALVFFAWYPSPLDIAVGVTTIFLMMLGIDIVIGPLLTFVIYKPNKPSLKLDLSVIACLQLAALLYGMHTVYTGRPAFIVFNVDRFDLIRTVDLEANSLKKATEDNNEAAKTQLFSPHWIAVFPPADPARHQNLLFSFFKGGPDLPQLPDLYAPLNKAKEQMLTKAKPLTELPKFNPSDAAWSGINTQAVLFLPLRYGKSISMTVLIDSKTAEVIKVVNVAPWQ